MTEKENETVEPLEELATNEAETVENKEVEEQSEADKVYVELAELKDKYLRLYADFENFRRRTAKEKIDIIGSANADLMRSLLPVIDDFERAMGSMETATEIEAVKEGINLIYNKFQKTLEGRGLKAMSSKGEVFDAELHESITQFPAPTEDLKGKVVDEVEKGYLLNEKVIRYAKVVVGS